MTGNIRAMSLRTRAFAALRSATWDDIGVGLIVAALILAMVML